MDEERYEFTRIIGKGRTGGVYQATDHELQRQVAVRRFFCAKGNTTIKGWEDTFTALTQNLSNLHHPSLIAVLEAGVDEDGAFMIYQLIEGESLAKRVDKGPLDEKDVYGIAEQLLDALHLAHTSGFIHGALSTGSINLISRPSGGYRAMLTDLGLSRLAPLIQGVESAYARMADPVIMPPEMFDDKEATAQSDLYMLGHLLYLSLIGGHPYAEQDLAELSSSHHKGKLPPITDYRDDLCPKFAEWISKLTQSDVKKRFSGASEALHSLPKLTPKTDRSTAPHSAAPKLIVPKLPNKVIHTSKVETLPVFIPKKQSPLKPILILSSITALLVITTFALMDSDENATPELAEEESQIDQTPLLEQIEEQAHALPLASLVPTLNEKKVERYATSPGKPVSKGHINITNNHCDDWIVYKGKSLTKQTSSHPQGDIIDSTTPVGSFKHLAHPLKVLRFHQVGNRQTHVPALHANSKVCDLDPGEGWQVKLITPDTLPNQKMQVQPHFTAWNCDAIITFKDKDGKVIGQPKRYNSKLVNTSYCSIEPLSNLQPGETYYLEITAGEPKSGSSIGLSLNALKIKIP